MTTNLLGQTLDTADYTHETTCDCVACKLVEKAVELFDTEKLVDCLLSNTSLSANDYTAGCLVEALTSGEFDGTGVQLTPVLVNDLRLEVAERALA